MKQIAILGSTGSIGTQALQVIEEHPDQYEAYVLTANNRVEDLIAQARGSGNSQRIEIHATERSACRPTYQGICRRRCPLPDCDRKSH